MSVAIVSLVRMKAMEALMVRFVWQGFYKIPPTEVEADTAYDWFIYDFERDTINPLGKEDLEITQMLLKLILYELICFLMALS